MIDRTALSLIALTIAASGAFTVVTKYNVPKLNFSFYGENPYAKKRDVIESTLTWTFTVIALLGVVVQGFATVSDLPERLHSSRTYGFVLALCLVAVVAAVPLITWASKKYARTIWEPQVVASQREAYNRAAYVVEHGVLPEQRDVPPAANHYEEVRKVAHEQADRYLLQIEELLEEPTHGGDAAEKVVRLRRYFGEASTL